MNLRRVLVALLIAAGASAVAYVVTTFRAFEASVGQLEFKLIDYRMRSSMSTTRDSTDVVLVLFDSSSIEAWPYLSPYPRAMLATLIDGVAANGAKAIGIDVFLDRQYPVLNAMDSGDVKLRESIRRAGNVVLVGPSQGTAEARTYSRPDPYFADVAAAVASADLPTPFETIRDGLLTVPTQQGRVPGFALALYALAKGQRPDSLIARAEQAGRLNIPGLPDRYARLGDSVQTVPILFEGPPSRVGKEDGAFVAYPAFALEQLMRFNAPVPWDFKDKIVLLGSGWHDSEEFRTPFYDAVDANGEIYGYTYGVEVHANALQNMLSGRFAVPVAAPLVWLLLLITSSAVAGVTFWKGVKVGAGVGVSLMAAEALVAFLVFQQSDLLVPIVAPAIAMSLAFLGSTSYVSIVEGAEKRMIQGMFGKYVSPRVLDQLVKDPRLLKLGGEKRQISMLFSDVAGFTSMSEILEPEKLVAVLNQYLHEMSVIVKAENGYIDKYIGDAIMALYGAPTPVPDHAVRVCRTAVRMQRRLTELNDIWGAADPTWPKLSVRIGLNTGNPVIGNIGGEEKIQYTALGDSVNLAARLEPACKNYGVLTMVSQATRDEAGAAIQVRELDLLAVYGKKEPIRVYELLALAEEDIGETMREALVHYAKGLEVFRQRDFELALQYFKAALEIEPDDGPSALYIERCEEYMVNPPPADWDFVERRQAK